MQDDIKYGGGHYTCEKCGQVHYGSTIHYCGENMPYIPEDRDKVITTISKFIEEAELLSGEELVRVCMEEAAECMADIVDIVKPEEINIIRPKIQGYYDHQ